MITPDRLRKFSASCVFMATATFALLTSAQNSARKFEDYLQYDTHLEIVTSDGKIALTPYSDKIVEVQFLTPLQPANPPSWSVVKKPAVVRMNVEATDEKITLDTGGIAIEIIRRPFQIRYRYRDKPLTSENLGYFAADGQSGFKFNLTNDEAIYGGGARALPMNRRGYRLSLYNTPAYGYGELREDMYYSIPLVISSQQYMILYDNAPKGILDIGKTEKDVLGMHSIGGRKAYYLIAGDSFLDLTTQYTDLTGRQPLPPRWVLGNIASRFGYHTQDEAEDTVAKYLAKSVPLDALVIDIYWFGKDIQGHMGNLAWNHDAWPKPKRMMQRFARKGIQTVLISEPFVLNTSKRWQEVVEADILAKNYRGEPYIFDFYFGTGGLLDIFKPTAKAWLWDIYRQHMDAGVSAWWGDLGEPESHAADMVHVVGSAEYVHNVYGHEWAKTLYQGYARDYPRRRPFSLMRAGFAGSQRYGMIPWSGDVIRHWQGLKPQPALAMQMGMQGLAYMHSDLGGFAPHYIDERLFSDPMLYVRWLQYGVFQPVFRPHSHESSPAEPVFWDQRTLDLSRQAINLRYRLLPYNYTLAYENAARGYPFMRPLFFAEPDNRALANDSTSYLWGDTMLVAPILQPQQKTQQVYFPRGSRWVDFYTGGIYAGGATATLTVVEDHIPTFVRAGAFLPMLPEGLQTTANYSTRELHLLYYADENTPAARYTLYDDDGHSHGAIENKRYELLQFSAERDQAQYTFTIASNRGTFKGRPKGRKITLLIDHLEAVPAEITVDDETVTVTDNESELDSKAKATALKLNNQKLSITVEHRVADVTIRF